MIEKIFNEMSPYLRGIKKADEYSVVEAHLKQSWLIPEHGTIQNQKKETKERGTMYYMFYSETDSFDGIIDWLKTKVIEMNIEVEQKEELLKEKVTQLKDVFENSSLDELKNLKFSTDVDVLKLNGKSNPEQNTVVKEISKNKPEKIES